MLRFVAVLSLVACAKAGAPIGYGGAIASYGGPGVAQYASPYGAYGSPAFGAYAARPVAHAVAAPVIRAGPVGYAPAHYAPQYAAAPVQAIHAAPVLRQQVAVAQPIVQKAVAVRQEPFDPHPQYNFGYSVSDQLTGDQHSHTESRDGGVVQGQYSLVEPDGAIRTVTYTSDPVNGFNAVVDRQRPQVAVQKVAAPVAFAQRPIAVAQPVRAVAHVAPAVTAVHAGAPYGYAQQAIAGPGYYHH